LTTLRVLFPGGAASFSASGGYADAAWELYQHAVSKNEAGDYFPVWGTCLGFELLTFLVTRPHNILTLCEAQNVALPLVFKPGRSALSLQRQPFILCKYSAIHKIRNTFKTLLQT
jgi:hypothetical protein